MTAAVKSGYIAQHVVKRPPDASSVPRYLRCELEVSGGVRGCHVPTSACSKNIYRFLERLSVEGLPIAWTEVGWWVTTRYINPS